MHQYQESDGEEDRKPGGNTRVEEIYGKCGAIDGGSIGQDKDVWKRYMVSVLL